MISARYTITALGVLSLLTSSYLLVLCQALDLRSMHHDLKLSLSAILRELLVKHFPIATANKDFPIHQVDRAIYRALDGSTSTDSTARMVAVAAATTTLLVDYYATDAHKDIAREMVNITPFRADFAGRASEVLRKLRVEYLEGERGAAPASKYLGKTKIVYEFVRVTLGIRMHGAENLHAFEMGPGVEEGTIGGSIALIHEAIRDGKMRDVIMSMVSALKEGDF